MFLQWAGNHIIGAFGASPATRYYNSSHKWSVFSFLFVHLELNFNCIVLVPTYLIESLWGCFLILFAKIKQNVGGGLISGVALAAKSISPSIRILAAEPKGANDAAQSKAAGKLITLPETNTVADGLRAFLGDLTWYTTTLNKRLIP